MKYLFFKKPNWTAKDENYNVWDENTWTGINSRLDTAEKRISELWERTIGAIQNKTQRAKENKIVTSVSELWNNFKRPRISAVGASKVWEISVGNKEGLKIFF